MEPSQCNIRFRFSSNEDLKIFAPWRRLNHKWLILGSSRKYRVWLTGTDGPLPRRQMKCSIYKSEAITRLDVVYFYPLLISEPYYARGSLVMENVQFGESRKKKWSALLLSHFVLLSILLFLPDLMAKQTTSALILSDLVTWWAKITFQIVGALKKKGVLDLLKWTTSGCTQSHYLDASFKSMQSLLKKTAC